MDEKEYGIERVSIRRGLDTTFLVAECQGDYIEDYQMRMLEENNIGGLLCLRGHGEEGASIYEYDISGKTSLKTKYKENKCGDSSSISPIYLKKSQAERAIEEKIKISKMNLEDIDLIAPNFETEFDKFWNINNLKNDFNNSNSTYFVAKIDNEIACFAGFLNICGEANIMNIVTKTNKRNLGIGSKLLEALISSAKEQNCKNITLEVNEHNNPAIHLYEKFNFERIGLRKKYYNNTDNAIIMTQQLAR